MGQTLGGEGNKSQGIETEQDCPWWHKIRSSLWIVPHLIEICSEVQAPTWFGFSFRSQNVLNQRGKVLSQKQLDRVCSAQKTENPLFLKIVLEVSFLFLGGGGVGKLQNTLLFLKMDRK